MSEAVTKCWPERASADARLCWDAAAASHRGGWAHLCTAQVPSSGVSPRPVFATCVVEGGANSSVSAETASRTQAPSAAAWFGSSGKHVPPAVGSRQKLRSRCQRALQGVRTTSMRPSPRHEPQTQKIERMDRRMGKLPLRKRVQVWDPRENLGRRSKNRLLGHHAQEVVHGRAFSRSRARARRSASFVVGIFLVFLHPFRSLAAAVCMAPSLGFLGNHAGAGRRWSAHCAANFGSQGWLPDNFMPREAGEPLCLVHVVDDEWCFDFSDRQVGYARLSIQSSGSTPLVSSELLQLFATYSARSVTHAFNCPFPSSEMGPRRTLPLQTY